ncbi:MAG TPA: hypothetical protein VM553_13730, partial [Dongiaceae bacterium]|nr:hypothetical protein [Dongiaceae bacterium]
MRNGVLILMLVCGLAGCATPSSSVLDPPDQQTTVPGDDTRYPGQTTAPTPGDNRTGYSTTPRPGSTSSTARRPTTVTYSPSSTGVSAADALLREGSAAHANGDYSA